MKAITLFAVWLFVLASASAQEQTRPDAGALGLFLLYLALVAVGLMGLILRQERAQTHIRAIRTGGRAVFWRGFAITLVALLLVLLLGALSESLKKAGDEPASKIVGLIALLIILAYSLMVLLGFGSVAVVVGNATAQLFGWRDVSAGWCVVLGSAAVLLVIWIPVFGWALGVYWFSLCVGGLWSRSEIAPNTS